MSTSPKLRVPTIPPASTQGDHLTAESAAARPATIGEAIAAAATPTRSRERSWLRPDDFCMHQPPLSTKLAPPLELSIALSRALRRVAHIVRNVCPAYGQKFDLNGGV
jgi:hypothetical protein